MKTDSPGKLAAAAYREQMFPALRLAASSRLARRLARWLLVALLAFIVAALAAPWQQTVTGTGSVVAYAPLDRRQVVEAPIKGRIVRWGEGVRENALVKKGQLILEIQDVDPNLVDRLSQQLAAVERQVEAARDRLAALQRQREANQTIVDAYGAQVAAFEDVKSQSVAAADEYIAMAQNKLNAEERKQEAARAARVQAEFDHQRQKQLHKEGFASELKMQLAERKFLEEQAKEKQAESHVAAAENELSAKRRERDAKEREAQAKIESAQALYRKARGDVAKTESEIAKAEEDVSKGEKDLLDSQVKLARQQSQTILAPRDGYIMQLVANQDGEYVKEGDPLFVLVPETSQLAVQVWVDGNDAPLVAAGRRVRLQFEGWPAVQFSGWPSVAVGTFGGRVALVDPSDDGRGKFRIVIVPDPDDAPWPEHPLLRQGARANAWVLLDEVTIGYEMWRRINGFPPALQSKQALENAKAKSPLPKP